MSHLTFSTCPCVVSASGSETSVSSSTPASAIIYDAYTSIIKKKKKEENNIRSVSRNKVGNKLTIQPYSK